MMQERERAVVERSERFLSLFKTFVTLSVKSRLKSESLIMR